MPPITDTKADGPRGRFGPKAGVHANCGVRVLRSNHCKVIPLVTAARQSNGAADRGARPYS
jgi:hypothetical protein